MRWLAIVALIAAIGAGVGSMTPAPRAGVAPHVTAAHAAVSELMPDDLAVIAVDIDPANIFELSPFVRLTIDLALMRGARVVTLSLSPQGAMLAERLLRESLADRRALYGRDAINLGFIEGRSTAVHVTGLPLQRAVTRDHAGTPIGDLSLAQHVARLSDAHLVVVAASGTPGALDWLLQAQGRFARALVIATSSAEAPQLVPFHASGQLQGLVGGARDVSAFADLAANDPRLFADSGAVSYLRMLSEQMRAQRWTHFALICCLVVGQGVTLWRGRRKGAK